jgi:hypothetical protein
MELNPQTTAKCFMAWIKTYSGSMGKSKAETLRLIRQALAIPSQPVSGNWN